MECSLKGVDSEHATSGKKSKNAKALVFI